MPSRTRSSPSFGNRIDLDPAGRTGGVAPSLYFERSRNVGVVLCRDLNRGNPAPFPARVPLRESDQFFNACAAFTLAVSNTSAETSPRHASPRVPSAFTRESAARPSFHAFMWLMNDTFDHDKLGVRSASAMP